MAGGANDTGSMSDILLDQADRLFGQHATRAVLAAADEGIWPAALWQAVEEAGLPLAAVSEEAGGVGLGAAETGLLVRRAAYHAVPLPLAETILAQALWTRAGGEPLDGPATLAPTNPRDVLALRKVAAGFVLEGRAERVPWGAEAKHVLALAKSEDGAAKLCLVSSDAATAVPARNVAYEPRPALVFDGVSLSTDAVRAAPADLDGTLTTEGAAVRAQQMTGAMERCLEFALAYVNERVQFGRPLAKFQAIQHMLAVAAGQVAAATAAADALGEAAGTERFPFAVAVAKARTGEAAGQVAAICHQVHGAMGFTQEHPLHFSTRRLFAWRDEFGAEAYWQAQLGRLVCRMGGEALWPLVTGERPAA